MLAFAAQGQQVVAARHGLGGGRQLVRHGGAGALVEGGDEEGDALRQGALARHEADRLGAVAFRAGQLDGGAEGDGAGDREQHDADHEAAVETRPDACRGRCHPR